MSEPGLPKTWGQAVPYVVWLAIIIGFGIELTAGIAALDWRRSLIAFIGLALTMAAAIHWPTIQRWFGVRSPAWAVVVILVVLEGLILSPFIEQRRWPFSWLITTKIIHEPPTKEAISVPEPYPVWRGPTPEEVTAIEQPLQNQLNAANQALAHATAQQDKVAQELKLITNERDKISARLGRIAPELSAYRELLALQEELRVYQTKQERLHAVSLEEKNAAPPYGYLRDIKAVEEKILEKLHQISVKDDEFSQCDFKQNCKAEVLIAQYRAVQK